jgi:Zn-dependent peptidase ImmA (M78 family)
LFHEIFHLIKRTSGICSIEIEQREENIETECNLLSAEFLVPLEDLKEQINFLNLREGYVRLRVNMPVPVVLMEIRLQLSKMNWRLSKGLMKRGL